MIIKELEVKKSSGMLRQDAQTLVQRAMRFTCSLVLEYQRGKVNLKSLMGVLSMGLKFGDKVMLVANGEDQDDAVEEIKTLFDNNFKF